MGVHGRRLGEEGFEVVVLLDLLLQAGVVVAGEPVDDLVDFFAGAGFSLGLLDVARVDPGEGHVEDATWGHGASCGGCGGDRGLVREALCLCEPAQCISCGIASGIGVSEGICVRHRLAGSTGLSRVLIRCCGDVACGGDVVPF